MAANSKTIRVVIKTAPLVFKGIKGEGEVSLIEESPISVLADKGSTGRHYKKRYHLKVDGFKVYPGEAARSDDPMYIYIMREHLDISQVTLGWTIKDGILVSSNAAVRGMHNTSDSQLVYFDNGIGGSIKGASQSSKDGFKEVIKTLTIHDLLHEADSLDFLHLGDTMVKKYNHIFEKNGVKFAANLFVAGSFRLLLILG